METDGQHDTGEGIPRGHASEQDPRTSPTECVDNTTTTIILPVTLESVAIDVEPPIPLALSVDDILKSS